MGLLHDRMVATRVRKVAKKGNPVFAIGPEIEVGETCCGNSGNFLGGAYTFRDRDFEQRRFRFLPGFVPEVVPTAGVMAGAQGSLYVYGGFRVDLPLGRRWIVSPGWATGLYNRSDRFDLGGPVEFRSGIEVAYRLPGGSRLGVCLYHLSNAGLFTKNPGSESLFFTVSAGLRRR